MKKPFCDICGAPADEALTNGFLEATAPVGEPRRGYEIDPGGGGHDGVRQCLAVARVNFTFALHPRSYGGPPDLCAKCTRDLVKQILDAIPYKPTPAEMVASALKGESL